MILFLFLLNSGSYLYAGRFSRSKTEKPRHQKKTKTSKVPKVIIMPAIEMDLVVENKENYPGVIKAGKTAYVRSLKYGTVRNIKHRVGDVVNEGGTVAVISGKMRIFKTNLRSPIKGIVSEVYAVDGENVVPGDSIAKIISIDKILVEIDIPEKDIEKIELGQKFSFSVPAFEDEKFIGEISSTSPEIYEGGVVKCLSLYNNQYFRFLPGMRIEAQLLTKVYDIENALVIPTCALYLSDKKDEERKIYTVFVLGDNKKLEARQVEVGYIKEDFSYIKNGLLYGDLVIMESSGNLEDGMEVNIGSYLFNIDGSEEEDNKKINIYDQRMLDTQCII